MAPMTTSDRDAATERKLSVTISLSTSLSEHRCDRMTIGRLRDGRFHEIGGSAEDF
jgi:hypothetical protein